MTAHRFFGEALDDGRRFVSAAERNREPILAVLRRTLPATGLVLEIGSGTGQHVAHFAREMPQLAWQPSDFDATAFGSIAAWVAHCGVGNVRAPVVLDVRGASWPVARADAVVCINVIHVAPWDVAAALLDGAARVLPAGGMLFLYGPYRRFGRHTAPSNEAFDAQLRASDPSWGVRDLETLTEHAAAVGLDPAEVVEMPANNFSVVFRRNA
jgi:SAM-dependent methyltransferase